MRKIIHVLGILLCFTVLFLEEKDSLAQINTNPKDIITQALNDINTAQKKLTSSSKVGRAISRKVINIVKEIQNVITTPQENCEENIISSLDKFDLISEQIEGATCQSLFKSTNNSKTPNRNCITVQTADNFNNTISNAIDIILSALEVDNNEDSIPDVCGSTSSSSTSSSSSSSSSSGNSSAGSSSDTSSLPAINNILPTSTSAGSNVTISGINLIDVTSVMFGAVNAATVTSASDSTKITAVVPPGSGTVSVSVTTPSGTSNSLSFTYPPPIISTINPTSASAGSSITILGVNFNDATFVKFGNVNATFTLESTTKITAVVPSGVQPVTGTVPISVITPSGTSLSYPNFTYLAN